jgi:hypothetical protein
LNAFTIITAILGTFHRFFPGAELLHNLDGTFGGEVLIDPLAVHLHHGGIGAGTQTLHLLNGKKPIRSGFGIFDAEMLFKGRLDLSAAAQLTRSSATELEMEFAHWYTIEHSVETGGFKNLDFRFFDNGGDFTHGTEAEEVVVLLLSQHKEGNAGGLLVITRVVG